MSGSSIGGAARVARALPAAIVTGLRAPRRARRHPTVVEVRALRHDGWIVESVAVSVNPPRAAVRLTRNGQVREIADNEPAFAAYAAALRTRLSDGPIIGGAT